MKKLGLPLMIALLTLVMAACAPQADVEMEDDVAGADAVTTPLGDDAAADVDVQTPDDVAEVADETFTVDLSGLSVVPAVETPATGTADVSLEDDMLTIEGTFQGLESDLMEIAGTPAHVHVAPEGLEGPIVFPLEVTANIDQRSGTFSLSQQLTPEQIDEFQADNYYVQIHTVLHPEGVLRAQLVAPGGL